MKNKDNNLTCHYSNDILILIIEGGEIWNYGNCMMIRKIRQDL